MKTPPLLLIILSIALIIIPFKCFNGVERNLLTLAKPFAKLHASDISAETVSPQKLQAMKPKDKMSLYEARIAELNAQVQLLKNENVDLTNKLRRVSDFREAVTSALNFRERYAILNAEVIFNTDVSVWRQNLLINKGINQGVKAGQTVVLGNYLVGRIAAADLGPYTSRVQLITDPAFKTQVMVSPLPEAVSPTAKAGTVKKAAGVVGYGVLSGVSFNRARVKWVSREVNAGMNWQVYSALDNYSSIPRGMIVGKVSEVSSEGYFTSLMVVPAVDFLSISDVQVLLAR